MTCAVVCLIVADRPTLAQLPPAPTIVVEQYSVAGRPLADAVLTCPGNQCEHVVRLDAAGASFGMAMRIVLDRSGAWFTLRGCEAGEGAEDCGSYGTGAADALLVPLDRNGYGRRAFVVGRIPAAVAGNPKAWTRWCCAGKPAGLAFIC